MQVALQTLLHWTASVCIASRNSRLFTLVRSCLQDLLGVSAALAGLAVRDPSRNNTKDIFASGSA